MDEGLGIGGCVEVGSGVAVGLEPVVVEGQGRGVYCLGGRFGLSGGGILVTGSIAIGGQG